MSRVFIAASLLSVFGCECSGGGGLIKLKPEMKVTPDLIAFGEVPLGATAITDVSIENTGSVDLELCVGDSPETAGCLELSRIDPAQSDFAAAFFGGEADAGVWVIPRGESRMLRVRFTPSTEGPRSAELILAHDEPAGPRVAIPISGSGVAPHLDFDPPAIDFGEVTVDTQAFVDLTLTNPNSFAQPFSIPPLMQSSIVFGTVETAGEVPGGGSTIVRVWYGPLIEGPDQNTLVIDYCPTCRQEIPLSGIGVKPAVQLIPPSLDFGTLDEGVSSTLPFTVRNVGNVALKVFDPIGIEADTPGEYTAVAPLPATLAPGEQLQVDVTYVGLTPGTDLGRALVKTNAWDDPNAPGDGSTPHVQLRAVSIGPDIDAVPAAVSFGIVAIGGTPVIRNVLLANVGNADLTIDSLAFTSAGAELSLESMPSLPMVLAPQGSILVPLAYAPIDAGLDEGTLTVSSNDRDEGSLAIPVSGVGGDPSDCTLTIAPSQVTFGLVQRGGIARWPVRISSTGIEACELAGMQLSGSPEFSLSAGAPLPPTLPVGAIHEVEIAFAPTVYGSYSGTLQIDSNDSTQPTVQIPISGASDATGLQVIPSALDFSVVPVGCGSEERAVSIYNTGADQVTITRVQLDPTTSAEFTLNPFAVPTTIAAGGSAAIAVHYHPIDVGSDVGLLIIESSDFTVPFLVPLTGEGQIDPTITDTFIQANTPKADILFVVDNSGSMGEEQDFLGTNLISFLTFAQAQAIDYQIAVTTTDCEPMPCPNGLPCTGERGRFVGQPKILTPATPDVAGVFATTVNLGTNGSGSEKGLEAAYLALSDPLIVTDNAGFLRPDAALAIIVVSDEEDNSPRPIDFYVDFFRNLKGFQNTTLFSFNSVVGTVIDECEGPGGEADYGVQYIEVSQATGGVIESICSANWGLALQNISLNSFGLRNQFPLSAAPVPNTIAVSVDGQPIAGGWIYDPATNSVVFTANAAPQAGATIAITYTVACLP